MKRSICALVSVIMILTVLVSCSGEAPELLTFIDSADDSVTFEGMEWKIGKVRDYFMDEDAVLGYVDNTGFSDAARERINSVEKTYDIQYKEVYVERVNDVVQLEAVNGGSSFHAVQDESFFLVDGIHAGLYADLTELSEYLDYKDSSKWGSRNVLEELCWDGGLYAVMPAAMPLLSYSSACSVIVANVDYIRGVGMPDPRTYWEDNTWTWDTFKQVLPAYTQVSEVASEYKYGLLSGEGWILRGMIHSNCGRNIVQDINGNYIPVTRTEAGRRAVEEGWNICYGELAYTLETEISCLDYESVFPSGNYAMVNVDSYQVYSMSNSLVYTMPNLAVLPFPTGPDMPAGTITSVSSSIDYATAIPVAVDEPWVSAIVINALYEPFEGYETEESLIEYMATNYFATNQDAEIFVKITKSTSPEYGRFSFGDYVYMVDDKSTVAAYIESNLSTANSILEENILSSLTTADQIFG